MAERTKPYRFVIVGASINVREDDGQSCWAAEIHWDDEDGCFVLNTDLGGNYDFAPCDLEELARFMRALKREP